MFDLPLTCRIKLPDIPRAGRVRAPGGSAHRGRARLSANRIMCPGNRSPAFPKKHEPVNSYSNLMRNKISSWPSDYYRLISRTRSSLRSWLPNNGTSHFCSVNTFHARQVRKWPGPQGFFLPGGWHVYRRLFVPLNPSYSCHVNRLAIVIVFALFAYVLREVFSVTKWLFHMDKR